MKKLFCTSRIVLGSSLMTALIIPNYSWAMGAGASAGTKASPPVRTKKYTEVTPCPFLNMLIHKGEIGAEETTVEELVRVARNYGISSKLMEKLASAVAESGDPQKIVLSKLLDPNRRPGHLGSLARADGVLDVVDEVRLQALDTFSTDGRISENQLYAYQKYCWSLSDMKTMDRVISSAEVQLLWRLFGAYREEDREGVRTIPLDLVKDFLTDNTLPDSFRVNEEDPATIGNLILTIMYRGILRR